MFDTSSIEFYVICALITLVGGLIAYIQTQTKNSIDVAREETKRTNEKLDKLSDKMDKYEEQNSKEHAFVEQCLATVEAKVDLLTDRINRIEDELRYYRREEEDSI